MERLNKEDARNSRRDLKRATSDLNVLQTGIRSTPALFVYGCRNKVSQQRKNLEPLRVRVAEVSKAGVAVVRKNPVKSGAAISATGIGMIVSGNAMMAAGNLMSAVGGGMALLFLLASAGNLSRPERELEVFIKKGFNLGLYILLGGVTLTAMGGTVVAGGGIAIGGGVLISGYGAAKACHRHLNPDRKEIFIRVEETRALAAGKNMG